MSHYTNKPASEVFSDITYPGVEWASLDNRFLGAMPEDLRGKLTGDERKRMADLLFAIWARAKAVGKEEIVREFRSMDARKIEDAAAEVAKEKLTWVLNNWSNLEVGK